MTDRATDRGPKGQTEGNAAGASGPIRRLGIFGGTFDPIHNGHLASAIQVSEAFALDRVLLIVSAVPPHKSDATPASAQQRLAMVRLATADYPVLEDSDLEMRRVGPSYTYGTLRELQAQHPTTELFLILGADAHAELDSWHRPEDVSALANLIVTSRPGYAPSPQLARSAFAANAPPRYAPNLDASGPSDGPRLAMIELAAIDVSASEIRARLERGDSVEGLVPRAVADYIRTNQVYPVEQGNAPS